MRTLQGSDLAILTARFGCARFGASRFGFVPCPEDVEGSGTDEPGEYIYKEEFPPETEWTLVAEDCVCRNLCTLALGTITTDPASVLADVPVTLSTTLSGVVGLVSGISRVNWGDGGHDESVETLLEDGAVEFTHTYNTTGARTITVTVTDERGCVATQTLAVTVTSSVAPTAHFSWAKDPETSLVSFTDTSTVGDGIDSWEWDFGDGNNSTEEDPTHTYSGLDPVTNTPFTVTLTVTGPGGSDPATALLEINSTDADSGVSD